MSRQPESHSQELTIRSRQPGIESQDPTARTSQPGRIPQPARSRQPVADGHRIQIQDPTARSRQQRADSQEPTSMTWQSGQGYHSQELMAKSPYSTFHSQEPKQPVADRQETRIRETKSHRSTVWSMTIRSANSMHLKIHCLGSLAGVIF